MRSDVHGMPVEMKVDGIETRGTTWGDVVVRHLDLPAGVDFTPLLKGLPDDGASARTGATSFGAPSRCGMRTVPRKRPVPASCTTGRGATPGGPTRASPSS